MITGVLKRTIEPTNKAGQFKMTEHFIFEAHPATEDHTIYDSTTSEAYHDAVFAGIDTDSRYVGPWPLDIDGKTYYIPQFDSRDDYKD